MRLWVLTLVLGMAACDRQGDEEAKLAPQTPAPANLAAPAQVGKPPAVVPMPETQAELDRMILAGYTPHAGHLHPPGVEQCPLAKGNEVVM